MSYPISITRTRLIVCCGLALAWMVLGTVESAVAQQESQRRGFLSLNGGFQATTSDFTDNVRFVSNVEEGDFSANYNREPSIAFDATGGVRVWRGLAIGVGVSMFDTDSSATVTARFPHPFYFDRHRQVDGSAAGLTRREIGIHVQATWIVPVTDWLDVAVFGGPTFFTVDQDLVTEVMSEDTYPFDTASFTGVTTGSESESANGFNVGVDVGFYFSKNVGVGGMARFSRATVDFNSVNGGIVSMDAGGLQLGGGLRVRF